MSAPEDRDPPRLGDEAHGPSGALVRAGRAYRPPLGRPWRPRPVELRPLADTYETPVNAVPPAESEARPRDPDSSQPSQPPSSSSGRQ